MGRAGQYRLTIQKTPSQKASQIVHQAISVALMIR